MVFDGNTEKSRAGATRAESNMENAIQDVRGRKMKITKPWDWETARVAPALLG